MATTVQSQQLWQALEQNQAGIRRLKLADAATCQILQKGVAGSLTIPVGHLIPLTDTLTWYEFIFPGDLACGLQIQMQTAESGAVFYRQSVSFVLPQLAEALISWVHQTRQTRWIALAEDWNGSVYLLGHQERGLIRSLQAGTGASLGDRNSQNIGLTAEQLVPYYGMSSYEDSVLFPNAAFTYGFSLGFES